MFQGIGSLTAGHGSAGNVAVTAGTITLVNNGEIESITGGFGKAGNVSVTAFDGLTIDGSGEFLMRKASLPTPLASFL